MLQHQTTANYIIKMNSLRDAVEIFIKVMFIVNLIEEPKLLDDIVTNQFKDFLARRGMKKKSLLILVSRIFKEQFGTQVLTTNRKKQVLCRVSLVYNLNGVNGVYPAKSEDQTTELMTFVKRFPTGSKVVFKRRLYYHTGLILQKEDGGADVLELRQEPTGDREIPQIVIRSVEACLASTNFGISIDNTCMTLKQDNRVDVTRILYVYSFIKNKSFAYDVESANCDIYVIK